MNGLKYIRTRCNLSLNDLAEAIGVTRQELSAWENERKEIPKQRKIELSDFFGIDSEYFGEISEQGKKYLLEKAMFRYVEDGKETYRYKPQKQFESKELKEICFLGDKSIRCPSYPCRQIKALEKSYHTRYHASLVENSRLVQEEGLVGFLEKQRERYICPECGGIISIHDGECSECQHKVR